jgi:hypothetical protein
VRRGRGNPIRVRRATIIMASASGTPVAAIARLVAAVSTARENWIWPTFRDRLGLGRVCRGRLLITEE